MIRSRKFAAPAAVVLALGMTAAPAAQAGPLSDLLLGEGAADRVDSGLWRHERRAPVPFQKAAPGMPTPATTAPPPVDEVLRLAPLLEAEGGGYVLAREASEDRPAQELGRFPSGSAGPIALIFLEGAVKAMNEGAGGNPFYIRNRIREAFGAAELGPVEAVEALGGTMQAHRAKIVPFADNPNRDRMGEFADLALVFTITPEGRLLSLSADTPSAEAGYHESFTLTEEIP